MMDQRTPVAWSRRHRPGRARVLIEGPDAALWISDFRLFDEAGLDVALCHGPDSREPCPLVLHAECLLAPDADVVVMGRGLPAHDRTEMAAAWRHHHPGTPVLAEVSVAAGEAAPRGCIPLPCPSSVPGQIAAIWRALGQTV